MTSTILHNFLGLAATIWTRNSQTLCVHNITVPRRDDCTGLGSTDGYKACVPKKLLQVQAETKQKQKLSTLKRTQQIE